MTVQIDTLRVSVPGQVTRKYDGTTTVLTVTAEQAAALFTSLGAVQQFFTEVLTAFPAAQTAESTPVTAWIPNSTVESAAASVSTLTADGAASAKA
jgi:hypothetical protein